MSRKKSSALQGKSSNSVKNPVARYAPAFNQSRCFTDRKKAEKRGYRRHKLTTSDYRNNNRMDDQAALRQAA